MSTFVKAIRSETASFLDFNPNANHLLNVIARRARRTECKLNNLAIGECFIGFKSVGLTEQQYRTAKKHLQKIGLVSFRVARKLTGGVTSGVTVAKLLDQRVYDINIDEVNATVTPTQRQPNANLTSNKNVKNLNNDNNTSSVVTDGFDHWWNLYPSTRRKNKKGCLAKFKSKCKGMDDDQVEEFVNILSKDTIKRINDIEDVKFMPMTEPYLNQERWNDGI